MDPAVTRRPPDRLAHAGLQTGQGYAFVLHPDPNLTNTLQFVELAKDQCNRFLDPQVRILLDTALGSLITGRHRKEQLAAFGLALAALQRAPHDVRKFKLRHRAVHAQDHAVTWNAWIVDRLFIAEKTADMTAELDQGMPLPPVSGEARSFHGKNDTVPIRLSPTPTICMVWRQVARKADEAGMDVLQREDLSFPRSLPEFQRLFPDDAACAAYPEKARWGDGFVCPHCQTAAEPFRFTGRPGVLRCRKCRRDTRLTAGAVMERTHTPLGVWFWATCLVVRQTPGMSATQFQRQVGTFPLRNCLSDPPQVPRWHGSAGSAARSATMSKSTKPGSAAVRAARAGAFTTNFLSPALLKCECASREPSSMSGRAVATQDVSDSLSCQTAARNRWRCHRSHLRRA